jgi:hypothetical protein
MHYLKVNGRCYNLTHLIQYVAHAGQHEVGMTNSVVDPEPIFGAFTYYQLIFTDGSSVTLDEAQSRAFAAYMEQRASTLDLDKVEEAIMGHVVVQDTEEGGDIILAPESQDDEPAPMPNIAIPPPSPFA